MRQVSRNRACKVPCACDGFASTYSFGLDVPRPPGSEAVSSSRGAPLAGEGEIAVRNAGGICRYEASGVHSSLRTATAEGNFWPEAEPVPDAANVVIAASAAFSSAVATSIRHSDRRPARTGSLSVACLFHTFEPSSPARWLDPVRQTYLSVAAGVEHNWTPRLPGSAHTWSPGC